MALLFGLEGCSAFNTKLEHAAPTSPSSEDGLVYHLPLKYLILSVKVEKETEDAEGSDDGDSNVDNKSQSATQHLRRTPNVTVSEAYPDLKTTYVLRYSRGPFSKNEMTIELNEKGLLSSAKAVSTSQVSETLKSIASAVPEPAASPTAKAPEDDCPDIGTYQKVVEVTDASETICGFTFAWKVPTAEGSSGNQQGAASPEVSSAQVPGIYYRQVEPIVVEAKWPANGEKTQFLAFVPNPRKPRFLRIPRTLFANSNAELTFVDGMPTKYAPTTESELLALIKLPSDVIGAYFGAVGKVFSAFSSADKAKASAAADEASLALQKWKTEQCLVAIKSKDATAIAAVCGTSQ